MANQKHVELLHAGPAALNLYADSHGESLDLRGADLVGLHLHTRCFVDGADFSGARLRDVVLENVNCGHCCFDGANIEGHLRGYFADATFRRATLKIDGSSGIFWQADFSEAILEECNFSWANLRRAKFDEANVRRAIFQNAELPLASFRGAYVSGMELMDAVLTGADLTGAVGLDEVHFRGRAAIDYDTIRRSGELPRSFLQGCGVPDELIDFYDATAGAIKFYSAFISHSSADKEFAQIVWRDLQNAGIRCWLAPNDLAIGDKFRNAIDHAIRINDKVLVILSESSIRSSWVESEVEAALEREHRESRTVLFPVTVDDAVTNITTGWPALIRRTRHIGDFRGWRDRIQYDAAFGILKKDLRKTE